MWSSARELFRAAMVAGARISSGVSRSVGTTVAGNVRLGNASVSLAVIHSWRTRFSGYRGKFWRIFVTSVPAVTLSSAFGGKMSAADAIKSCDQHYDAGDMVAAHEAIMAVKDDPNPEVRWRIARMQFKAAERTGKQDEIDRAIQDGLKILHENVEVTPKCPNTHKWIAILLGSKENHETFKQQIEEAFLIREHLEKAIEYNPTDGYAHYILGKWCYQVTSVSWYKKKAAAALFASPPESTYEIALGHFKDAERLKPDIFTTCYLMAAKCLIELGKKDEAGEYLNKCIAKEDKDKESKKNADEARQIAKKNGIKL